MQLNLRSIQIIRRVLRIGFMCALCCAVPSVGYSDEENTRAFEVSSGFSTAETTMGREVTYSVTIRKMDGSSALILKTPERPELPKTSALTFGRFQTTEQYQSAMGSDPVGITMVFEAVTNEEGRIIMPSYSMEYMGEVLQVPAAAIDVRSPEMDLTGGEVEWFFLELAEPPDNLHVGERFKTSLNLYVFRGLRNVTFTSPTPVGSDFSMDRISPSATERVVTQGLYRYSMFSWPLTFTPVRSGKISISFKLNLNFRIPNDRVEFIRAARANNAEGAAIIESLLQDSREESQVLFSDNLNLVVESLPVPDDDASFYNAIGEYELDVQVDNKRMQVGNPANLTITISGEGNFGSFKSPLLSLDKRWRVFAPQESFEDEDFLGFKGKQVYRYVIIPLSVDLKQIPVIEYTYFDVEESDFVTLVSEPINVSLAGENIVSGTEAERVEVETEQVDEAEVSLTSALRWELDRKNTLGAPFFKEILFYLVQVGFLLLFALLVFLRWRKLKIDRDRRFARQLQVQSWVRKYLRLAGIAAREEDSEQFYESAFLSFCAVVASNSDANVEAITVEDVEKRMQAMKLNDSVKRVIEGYLRRYEQHRFSGSVQETPPLVHEFERLKSVLKKFDRQLEA